MSSSASPTSPGIRPTPELLLAPARIVALARRYDPATWREDPILAASLTRVHELESRRSARSLLETSCSTPPARRWRCRWRSWRSAAAISHAARWRSPALWLTLRVLGLTDRFAPLLSGVDNRTLEANRALETLASAIRNDPALATLFASQHADQLLAALQQEPAGRAFLERFAAFLESYGHRETGSPLLVSEPTWKDSPQTVLSILAGDGAGGADPSPLACPLDDGT